MGRRRKLSTTEKLVLFRALDKYQKVLELDELNNGTKWTAILDVVKKLNDNINKLRI